MNSINEAVKKGPLMTMTLECEIEFPNILKDLMEAMDAHGEAVYKGFPVMDEGVEYWWVQLHLYKNKEDNHKESGFCMVTNSEMHTTFFDSARNAAWNAIKELGDRLKCRMLNTQNDIREEKKHTQELEATDQCLREDIIDLAMDSCDQDQHISSRDALLADLASEWEL